MRQVTHELVPLECSGDRASFLLSAKDLSQASQTDVANSAHPRGEADEVFDGGPYFYWGLRSKQYSTRADILCFAEPAYAAATRFDEFDGKL